MFLEQFYYDCERHSSVPLPCHDLNEKIRKFCRDPALPRRAAPHRAAPRRERTVVSIKAFQISAVAVPRHDRAVLIATSIFSKNLS